MNKPKNTTIKSTAYLKLSASVQYEGMRKSVKKNWWLLALIWLLSVGIGIITAFLITGWLGVLVGLVLSFIPFYLGTKAIMTIIQKDIYHDN